MCVCMCVRVRACECVCVRVRLRSFASVRARVCLMSARASVSVLGNAGAPQSGQPHSSSVRVRVNASREAVWKTQPPTVRRPSAPVCVRVVGIGAGHSNVRACICQGHAHVICVGCADSFAAARNRVPTSEASQVGIRTLPGNRLRAGHFATQQPSRPGTRQRPNTPHQQ